MKKVMVFGTFDIFHAGHRNFFMQARKYGNFLYVVIARDATVEKVKKKKPTNNERKRKKYVEESRLADEVVLGNLKNKYAVIENYKPDVICLGYDQTFFIDELKNKLAEFGLKKTKIIRLKPHKAKIYKSSLLRKKRQ